MNTTLRPLALAAAVLAAAAFSPSSAVAAESYDSCTDFIDTLPAVISTQGVWCLRHNLTTAIGSGAAIKIDANNVTIDCNDFKIGGLAAGDGSLANGIVATDKLNATVRNCGIRGFMRGVALSGGAHLVENNRFDQNLFIAVVVNGDDNVVRGNRVYDTGGSTVEKSATGIYGSADVIDNVVAGVYGAESTGSAKGISTYGVGDDVSNNRVRRILPASGATSFGIQATGIGSVVSGNRILGTTVTGTALSNTGTGGFCAGNMVRGFSASYAGCANATGNLPAVP